MVGRSRLWIVAALAVSLALALALALAPPAGAEPWTDSAGRTVELPAQVGKVLAAGPPASVVVYTLAPDKFLGWTRGLDEEALSYLPSRYRTLPVQVRITGRDPAPPGTIRALGADIIVDYGTVNATYAGIAERTQSAAGIPYVLVDGALSKTPAAYRALGKVVRAEARGELLAVRSQAILDEVKTKLAGVAPRRVYVARGPDGDETYGAGPFTDEVLMAAGARNVAATWGQGTVRGVTPEKVREADPDMVIATDPYFLEVISGNADWRRVPAIAAGRIVVAPRHPWGWLDEPPSVNRLIGIRWLAGLLHSANFSADIRVEAREFYRAFYQSDLSAAHLDRLLLNAVPTRR